MRLQISIDCQDPHALSRFWANALSCEVNVPPIDALLAAGIATPDDIVDLEGRQVWRIAATCSDPNGTYPRMLFTKVPETKAVKNRLHFDLFVDRAERDTVVEHLVGLGAARLYDGRMGSYTWVTMADPEGIEFCVSS
jgi:Glyoxalase-like domain